MDKKNRLSTDYDDDMDWLDDDDDYLDDGGLLSSFLFGDKKKKKKKENTDKKNIAKDRTADVSRQVTGQTRSATKKADKPQNVQVDRGSTSAPSARDVKKRADRQARPASSKTRPGSETVAGRTGRPVSETVAGRSGRVASETATGRTGRPVRSVDGQERPVDHRHSSADRGRALRQPMADQIKKQDNQTDTPTENVYREESAATRSSHADRTSRSRRKVSADRTPVRLEEETKRPVRTPGESAGTVGEYDEYYHENSRSRRMRSNRAESQNTTDKVRVSSDHSTSPETERTRSSVDNLLREVSNLEADSKQRHEDLRREAWERAQRNVAKAKAEVERLELEREQNEKEEARKRRVREEMQRRQDKSEKQDEIDDTATQDVDQNNADNKVEDNVQNNSQNSEQGNKESVSKISEADVKKADSVEVLQDQNESKDNAPVMAEDGSDAPEERKPDEATGANDDQKRSDILDMDALERIERDIDEDKLKYSESDTEDLALGDIGRALGFDAVDLEDDEEEPEDDEETDSEKFFRENLLDEADPKVVNPERKRLNISTKVWAIAFFVLLALFTLICVIYVKNYARMKYNEMNINEISSDQLLVNDGVKDATSGYRTIALYGVDSRDQNMDAGTNSDSIMIVSINESTKEIKLVSVYRDTLMEIASGAMNQSQKVNYAYQLGGAVTAINTLNTNLDLNITDYVSVDFNAMSSIIDAVGGVDVQVTDEEINNFNKNLAEQISISGKYSSGITQSGQYTLDGQQAVAYSRIRSTGKGDITRTERQRIILMKVIDKLIKADTGSLSAFVDVSFKNISTSLNKDSILDILKDVAKYKVTDTVGFPFAYEAVDMADKGNCLVAADMESNVKALHEYLYGNSHYSVTDAAKQISAGLEKETGVAAQKVKVESEKPGDGISDGKTEGDLRTITEPPKGMILDE